MAENLLYAQQLLPIHALAFGLCKRFEHGAFTLGKLYATRNTAHLLRAQIQVKR